MKKIFFLLILCLVPFPTLYSQVGVDTSNPQQTLHIAGSTGTLRVDSLNGTNNDNNGGDADGDTDPTNDTYPLYVDENGEFTLELSIFENSDDTDAFDDTTLPTSTVTLLANDGDGIATTTIKTYSITVSRPTVIEAKYGLSFNIYLNSLYTDITDNYARRVQTYITVTGQTRKYAAASKVYASGSTLSVNGDFYNSSSSYLTLPAAGVYDITFMGLVDAGVKASGGGDNSQATYVEFATGNDFVFMRVQ
jgi:hypothetical protein